MTYYCNGCHGHARMTFVRDERDGSGRRWEVYRCARCGSLVRIAVT